MQWRQALRKGQQFYESDKPEAALKEFSKCQAIDNTVANLHLHIAAAEWKAKHWEKVVSPRIHQQDI